VSKLAEAEAVAVATRLEPNWNAARQEHNLNAVHARVLQGRRRRKAAAISAGVLIAAAACFALVTRFTPTTDAPQVAMARVLDRTQFADGSVAELVRTPGSLALVSATDRAVEMRLDAGEARFDVTPNPERRFVVHAGEITVRVLGTSFVVERDGARVRVAVERGRVEVEWAESITRLSAGESRWFPGDTERSAEEPVAQELPELPTPPAGAGSTPAPARSSARERFVEHALRGEYAAAYAIMSESPSAVGNSAEDLLLAADSARLSNHPEQAVVYLRRITREHAKDSRAPLAAFTLGRVLMSQLGRPGEAEGAFALVRKLSPGGALAEDALARQAEALWRAGNRDRARALALDYRSRHPSGKHLSSLQKLGALD